MCKNLPPPPRYTSPCLALGVMTLFTAALTHHMLVRLQFHHTNAVYKTNIRRMTLELMQRVWLLLIAGLHSDKLLINEDWLIDASPLQTLPMTARMDLY